MLRIAAAGLLSGASMVATTARATPFTLDYSVSSIGGGLFDYQFTLVLDNHDSSWVAGQDFNWIIFGDQSAAASPLTDFVLTVPDSVFGFAGFNTSSGFHNGPTLINDTGWTPTAIGNQLTWEGTSTANLGQGQLLWSNLAGADLAKWATFEVAQQYVAGVPEPGVLALLLLGLAGLAASRAKGKRRGTRQAQAV